MLSLNSFIEMLENVKPRVTRRMILEGNLLSPELRTDLHERDAYFLDTVILVGPDAARAILDTYKAGRLPMIRKGLTPAPTPAAEEYVAQAERWYAEIEERNRLRRAQDDPSLLRSSDLANFRLLNQVFIRQLGVGPGTLVLAGHEVTKSLLEYRSNSGRSRDWQVSFSWMDDEGKCQVLEKHSRYETNRRNDADRNWGLPE